MRKILIFGNSGSGKSTLAKKLCKSERLAHLDLDTLAWEPGHPPERRSIKESELGISNFIKSNEGWVIEGCYSDLLAIAAKFSNEAIFLNLPIELCVKNAKNRPWEPHKYESKEAQHSNLSMLIDWIELYSTRTDTCSYSAHINLYQSFTGTKIMYTSNI